MRAGASYGSRKILLNAPAADQGRGNRIITDLAGFSVTANGVALVELAPGADEGETRRRAGCGFRIT